MKILYDTCVILDYLMDRKPFSKAAYELIRKQANNEYEGLITVKSMMDIHCVLKNKLNSENKTRVIIKDLTEIFEVVDSSAYCMQKALDSKINDYEDALMSITGEIAKVDYFITRNIKDYKYSNLNVKTPEEFLAIHKN